MMTPAAQTPMQRGPFAGVSKGPCALRLNLPPEASQNHFGGFSDALKPIDAASPGELGRALACLASGPFFPRKQVYHIAHQSASPVIIFSVHRCSEIDTGAFQKDGKIFQTTGA